MFHLKQKQIHIKTRYGRIPPKSVLRMGYLYDEVVVLVYRQWVSLYEVLGVVQDGKRSLREKLQGIQDVCLQVQEGMDSLASLGERVKK